MLFRSAEQKLNAAVEAARAAAGLDALPAALRAMPLGDFCMAYGEALRGEAVANLGALPGADRIVKQEAKRRKMRFVDAATMEKSVSIGQSECQMISALGYPTSANKTVGRWGTHVQHVYGRRVYIYTENGVVTSYQN